MQGTVNYLQEHPEIGETEAALLEYWGSVPTAMVSLYMASMNGDGWKLMANSLDNVGRIFYGLFLLYVAFFGFVVLNTLNGLFVEAMLASNAHDQRTIIEEQLEKKTMYIR